MVHAAAFRYDQGDNDGARKVVLEAIELARATNDSPALGYGLHISGLVEMAGGNPVAAEACFEEGLGVWQEIKDPSNEAEMLYNLGLLAGSRGDAAGAHDMLARSIDMRRRAGRDDETHIALTFIAAVAVMTSDLAEARTAMRESLRIGRQLGDRRLAWSLDVCACLAIAGGDPATRHATGRRRRSDARGFRRLAVRRSGGRSSRLTLSRRGSSLAATPLTRRMRLGARSRTKMRSTTRSTHLA